MNELDDEPKIKIPVVATFEFGIVAAGRQVGAVGRIGHGRHGVKVALLLHDVGLALPLPDEQLAQTGTSQRDPVAGGVDGHRADLLVRDLERVDQVDVGHLVQQEGAVAVAGDEQLPPRVVRRRRQLDVVQRDPLLPFSNGSRVMR